MNPWEQSQQLSTMSIKNTKVLAFIDGTVSLIGQLTPKFNLLPIHSELLVHYVCTNFRNEYIIIIDKLIMIK